MKKTFRDELDVLLLADVLHGKKCTQFHGMDRLDMIPIENKCFYHNQNIVLAERVKQAVNKNYQQQAKDILTLCENMNMQKIIKLVSTIIEP